MKSTTNAEKIAGNQGMAAGGLIVLITVGLTTLFGGEVSNVSMALCGFLILALGLAAASGVRRRES